MIKVLKSKSFKERLKELAFSPEGSKLITVFKQMKFFGVTLWQTKKTLGTLRILQCLFSIHFLNVSMSQALDYVNKSLFFENVTLKDEDSCMSEGKG